MKTKDLKAGDRIRIFAVTGQGNPNLYLHPDTRRVYKKLIARKGSVRIYWIDEYGSPWYWCRFKRKNGTWEYHSLSVMDTDANWVLVKKRSKKS
jgi:hypothetical protein